jgi:Tol biopolymer transport system component
MEIWLAQSDGTLAEQVTSIGGEFPRWFPDGKQLVFQHEERNGKSIGCLVAASGGAVRKLTDGSVNDQSPSVSHDGKWIYFTSDRTRQPEIFRMKVDGQEVSQLTHHGGQDAEETPDGKQVVFMRGRTGERAGYRDLWMVSTSDGQEKMLPIAIIPGQFAVGTAGIYFIPFNAPGRLSVYDLATGKISPIRDMPELAVHFSVSPDGRTILCTITQMESDLMLVDNFR